MKTLFRTRSIWILVLAPILAAALLIFGYNAIATARRAAAVSARPDVPHAPPEEGEEDIEKRAAHLNLNRFYGTGPGQVSSAKFAASLATARALPPSPLLRNNSVVSGSEQNWTYPVPPPLQFGHSSGVRIDAIAVHPTYADTVYVGSEGGLAKSTDGGGTWTILSDGLLSQSIRSIAIDPGDPEIVYVGTGTGHGFGVGIYRSDDGGESWDLISGSVESSPFSGKGVVKIVVDPNTAGSTTTTTVYASVIYRDEEDISWHVFWRSTDSGSNWTDFKKVSQAGGEPFGFYDIALNPDDPSQVYITAPDGVFKRDAWGTGSDWDQIHSQITTGGEPAHLAFAYTNPWALLAELFLAYQDGNDTKIFKSESPSYSTWDPVGNPTAGTVFCFGVDPAHPNRMFVGGFGSMRYSMDGGNTWLNPNDPDYRVHVDIHSLAFCSSNAERNYLGTDGGIYRADPIATPTATPTATPSPSITWVNKNQNLPGILTQGVSIGSDDRIFIGTQDNANQISRPANPRAWEWAHFWTLELGHLLGGDGWIPFIEFENNTEKIYAVTYTNVITANPNGFPARIINGTPASVTPPGAIGEYSSIFPAMSVEFKSNAYSDRVLMGFQHVWRSTNSGNNWTRIGGTPCPTPSPTPNSSWSCGIDPGSTINDVYEAPSNGNYVYAITRPNNDETRVFMTSNAADWVNITRNLPAGGINSIVVHPTDPQTVYVTGASHVYKNTDPENEKSEWEIDDPGSDFIYRDVKFHPDNPDTIIVASHRGVFARVDDEWGSLNANLPAGMGIVNISFNKYSHQLAAAAYGRGVYVLDLDREAPSYVVINSPSNGAFVRGTVTVIGTATDNHRIDDVNLLVDGNSLDGTEVPDPNVSLQWNTTLYTNGSHELELEAFDPYGNNTMSSVVTVTVDNSAPTVAITEPEDNKTVKSTVAVSADASDNVGVAGVQFDLDGNDLGVEDTSAPFSINWNTALTANGEHRLKAFARDAAGNITESEAVTVVIEN